MNARINAVLLKLLSEVNGSTFITLDSLTYIPVNKTLDGDTRNPHYGMVTKRITGCNVIVFQNKSTNGYASMVKRRLVAEGKDPEEFQLSAPRWGKRLPNLPVVEHCGEYYLEVIVLHPGQIEWLLNRKPVDRSSIMGLRSTIQPSQGGLSNKVVIRRFAFSSLTSIRINNRTVELRQALK